MATSELTLRKTSMGVVICYRHRPSLKDCFRRGKAAPGSYAAELVERVYEWYVDGALDLKTEYTKYYKPEYRSVEAFLYYRQGCTHGDLKAMKRDLNTDRRIGLVLGSMDWEGHIQNFLYEEGGDEIAARILGAKWAGAK